MKNITIATTKYNDKFSIEFITGFNEGFKLIEDMEGIPENDIQILLRDNGGKVYVSAISHFGSYGVEEHLWETMVEGEPDVTGYLTFEEVMKKVRKVVKDTKWEVVEDTPQYTISKEKGDSV